GQLPEFDIYLGPDYWDTVILFNSSSRPVTMEIIHVLTSDYIHVCLINTGRGTPFISTIELRLLARNMYQETDFGSLYLFGRLNFGNTYGIVRYKADKYDRRWIPITWPNSTSLYTFDQINSGSFGPPDQVMRDAITPKYPNDSFVINWGSINKTDKFFTYMHFAEIETLKKNQTRQFNIYMNGNLSFGPFSPYNHTTATVYSTKPEIVAPKYTLTLNKTKNSTLPPIINALELYTLKHLPQRHTNDQDTSALLKIKSTYKTNKNNWQGDPCIPQEFVWDGIGCSYDDTDSPRIVLL
ncbi:hypothetical protein M8C21_027884, partial [Ambrosia artemisiifolia]